VVSERRGAVAGQERSVVRLGMVRARLQEFGGVRCARGRGTGNGVCRASMRCWCEDTGNRVCLAARGERSSGVTEGSEFRRESACRGDGIGNGVCPAWVSGVVDRLDGYWSGNGGIRE